MLPLQIRNYGSVRGSLELTTKATVSLGEDADIRGLNSLTLAKFTLFEGGNNNPIVSFDRLEAAELEGRGGKAISVDNILTMGLKASISGNFPLNIDIPEINLLDLSQQRIWPHSIWPSSI